MPISGAATRPTKRWMAFVDGENFTIRGQEAASEERVQLEPGLWWIRDAYLWRKGSAGRRIPSDWGMQVEVEPLSVRTYYYTSVGSLEASTHVEKTVHSAGFIPRVFVRRNKQGRSKGVDIALSVDMLSHARDDHFDVALLFTSDADYVPLIEAVMRMGKIVWVVGFERHTAPPLMLAPDLFADGTAWFLSSWR